VHLACSFPLPETDVERRDLLETIGFQGFFEELKIRRVGFDCNYFPTRPYELSCEKCKIANISTNIYHRLACLKNSLEAMGVGGLVAAHEDHAVNKVGQVKS